MWGYHMYFPISEGVEKLKSVIKTIPPEFKTVQIFVSGPYNSTDFLNNEQIDILNKLSENKKIFVHASYLDHLTPQNINFTYRNIAKEIEICEKINASGFIVHIPAIPEDEIKNALNKVINAIKSPDKVKIYLEINTYKTNDKNNDKTNNTNYAKIENLRKLIPFMKSRNLGLVIDTAHLWASGVDIRDYNSLRDYISEIHSDFSNIIFHLNDQKYEFAAGKDQHMPIGEGTIWKNSMKTSPGWKSVVDYAKANNSTIILEYPPNNVLYRIFTQE